MRSSSPLSGRGLEDVTSRPELSKDTRSYDATANDLFLRRQPLSVRKVRGTWTFHPSMNFLRIWSGTRYAALVPTKPGIRVGRLWGEDGGSATGGWGT